MFEKGDRKCYEYQSPPENVFVRRICSVLRQMKRYLKVVAPGLEQHMQVDILPLGKAIARVEQRKEYFLIFHKQTKLNEVKEAALLAYWLAKYRPFHLACPDKKQREMYHNINETFAVSLLVAAIEGEVYRRCRRHVSYPEAGWRKITRAFTEWDISKESLILMSETMCEALCIKGTS